MERNADGTRIGWGEEDTAERLLEITRLCRPSMHEPEEGDLGCKVLNADGSFDNAMGDDPHGGEITVALTLTDYDDETQVGTPRTEHFNLATLVALARVGAETILGEAPGPNEVRVCLPHEVARSLSRALRVAYATRA